MCPNNRSCFFPLHFWGKTFCVRFFFFFTKNGNLLQIYKHSFSRKEILAKKKSFLIFILTLCNFSIIKRASCCFARDKFVPCKEHMPIKGKSYWYQCTEKAVKTTHVTDKEPSTCIPVVFEVFVNLILKEIKFNMKHINIQSYVKRIFVLTLLCFFSETCSDHESLVFFKMV